MSIEPPTHSISSTMETQDHTQELDKKHKHKHKHKNKSKDGEKKKRKRERDQLDDNGQQSKSKKRRTDNENGDPTTTLPETQSASPFHLQTNSLFLPLAPISQRFPLEGLCAEHLSPLILTYYPPFKGVILSYSNPRISERPFGNSGAATLFTNINEYAASWAWVTADFLLFKPERNAVLEGFVNLQNEGHLGLVCWNLFNASVERKRLPKDWRWVEISEARDDGDVEGDDRYAEEAGHYVDGEGNKIEGKVQFRVKETESSHDRERGFLSIEGTMLSEEEERQLRESSMTERRRDDIGRRLGGSQALGATSLGIPIDREDVEKKRQRH